MATVRRPINLQISPSHEGARIRRQMLLNDLEPSSCPSGGLSRCQNLPSAPVASQLATDMLPSLIIPHLYVGNREQTNRETLNRLNITYILSLGQLPLVSTGTNTSSSTPTTPITNSATCFTPSTTATATTTPTSTISPNSPAPMSPKPNQCGAGHLPPANSSRDFRVRLRAAGPSGRDENKGSKIIRCKCINIADNSEQSLTKILDEAHQFIDEAMRKKCNILVHCLAGISRSPAVAIAYLMRVKSLGLQEAYDQVKQCRPQSDPNVNFVSQLMAFEKAVAASSGLEAQLSGPNSSVSQSNTAPAR